MQFYKSALDIQKSMLHSNHPALATTYNNIGSLCFKNKDTENALLNYNNALLIAEKNGNIEFAKRIKENIDALD